MLNLNNFISGKSKFLLLHLVCIVVISLTPFLWLRDGSSVIGHDTGYAILPVEHFVDRLFTWTHRYGLGADQSFATPGFFIHGFEALAYIVSAQNHSLSQRIVFSFYMLGMGLSMYFVARELFPRYKNALLPLFAAVLYEVNHFVLQAWFIAERPKFLTYIALPLLFLILHKLFQKKVSGFRAGIFTSVIFLFLNGGGAIPLFGALIVGVALLILIYLFLSKTFFRDTWNLIQYGLTTILFSALLQAYWLLPYISFVKSSFSTEVAKSGGIEGVLSWVASISQDTSYANLFRLQGIQEWYVNPFHTYAHYYFSSPILILASFLFPVLFLYSLLKHERNDRAIVASLSLLALVGMLFMAGTHQPFGAFYTYLLRNVPGFIAFRTPFYKFAPLLWLSFSLLIGYALSLLKDRFLPTKFHNLFSCLCIILVLGYHFPFFSSQFFTYGASRTTKVHIPDYVFSYGKWMNLHGKEFGRTLVYPPISQTTYVDETDWGYWSLSTVFSLLDRHSYAEATVVHTQTENQLIQNVTDLIDQKDSRWIEAANLLGVDSVVVVKDRIVPPNRQKVTTEAFGFLSQQGLQPVKTFGKWELYKIPNTQNSPFGVLTYIVAVNPSSYADLSHVLTASERNFDGFVHIGVDVPNLDSVIVRPKCEQCLLELPLAIQPPNVLFDAPGMPFYSTRKAKMEKDRLIKVSPADQITNELNNSVRYLSYIRFIFNAHSSTPVRVIAWRDYVTVLSKLSDAVDLYVQTTPDLEKRNELLQTTQSTVILQWRELLTYLRTVNDIEESGSYQQVLLLMSKLNTNVQDAGYFSTKMSDKKYVISADSSFQYQVKLNPATTSTILGDKAATISAYLEDKQIYSGPISANDQWFTLKNIDFPASASMKFMIRDQFVSKIDPLKTQTTVVGDDTYKTLSLDDRYGCAELSLGKLPIGKYEVSFIARSPEKSTDIDSFSLTKSEAKPLLPFWGEHVKLLAGMEERTKVNFYTIDDQEQLLRVCNLYAIEPITIQVRDLTIQRISAPELVFIGHSDAYQPVTKRGVRLISSSQTAYEMDVDPGEAMTLALYQQYHPDWRVSDPLARHIQVNGFANGWVIPKSNVPTHLKIEFDGQKTITKGAKITLLGIISILLVGVYAIYKRIKSDK